ncbi:EAL domain-containing protein [Baekduia soli]|uniref:EAL domain-containing protein n=1 Tax=Baekduia soli TaxID=496014 RepID=A0A5B8U9D9_9ACTN|nr:GGDEF and EAL domain-containing protein [Baekduia soli]QEC49625.1 EAL domain-containing protein [Baekduia soli]
MVQPPERPSPTGREPETADALIRALEVATSGILVADATRPERPILYVNRTFERLFAADRAELLGRPSATIAAETAGSEVRAALGGALTDSVEYCGAFSARRLDGSTFSAEIRVTPAHDGAGRLVEWIAVVDDVTEREEARDRVEVAEARFRGLVENIPAVAYVADWDEQGTLQYVSPQIERLLGYPAEDFLADQELWYRCIHPDDRERVRAQEREAWATGEPFDLEFRMLHRDGRELWVWDKEGIVMGGGDGPRFSQGVLIDVTPVRETRSELADERYRAQRYLDIAGAIIVVLDADGHITLLNRAGHELLGRPDGAMVGRDWFDTVVPEADRTAAREHFERVLHDEADHGVHESAVLTDDGEQRVIAWRNTVLRDPGGRPTAMMSSGVDLTERRAAEEQIAFLAYHDSLTGLPNRALLQEHLELALARARRAGNAIALLYLDLDGFKLVNDSLGHAAGDELLCHVTMRLQERRRGMDLLARQGGDEFLLLLGDLDRGEAEATARRVAESLLHSLNKPFTISGAEFHIGASIGISLFPRDAADADELLRHADASMYDAKAAGRNGVTVYTGDPHEPLERLSMTSRLRKALTRGEFALHWQPVVDPADGTLHKLEALIRWEDPFRGLVMPDEFIAFAEETGFIDRIGDWVLAGVGDQVAAWRRDGLVVPRVAVNVSPRQLRRPDFGRRLLQAIGERGLAGLLTVEITESAAMADPMRTDPVLQELFAAGVEIAIDDFGAGYSSLSRLRTMPVQVLKIDRSFLRGVPEDPEPTAIVTAVIELSSALGMEAVAEGVEHEHQRAFLVQRGCPLAQGFLLGEPVPAEALRPLLAAAGTPRP